MTSQFGDDDFSEIESLLGELGTNDLELAELPDGLWEDVRAATIGTGPSNVVSLETSKSRSSSRGMFAAAAALVLVAGVVGVILSRSSQSTVLASAQLAYDAENFDDLGATANASVLLVDDDGQNLIKIDQSDLPEPTGEAADLELWLIEPDASGQPANLVSLGLIDPTNPGEFTVPEGFDPDIYFVVDISVEPRDGDASHSGRSILRGALSDA